MPPIKCTECGGSMRLNYPTALPTGELIYRCRDWGCRASQFIFPAQIKREEAQAPQGANDEQNEQTPNKDDNE